MDIKAEVKKLSPKEGDLLVFRVEEGIAREKIEDLVDFIEDLAKHKKITLGILVISPPDLDLSLVSEEEMNKIGWYRKEVGE